MRHYRKFMIAGFLALIFLSSGCVDLFGDGQPDDNEAAENKAKKVPEVEDFIDRHPEADLSSSVKDKNYLLNNIEDISSKCSSDLNSESYYRVEISSQGYKYVVWVSYDNLEVVCVYTKGSEPTGEKEDNCISACPGGSISEGCFEESQCKTLISLGSASSMKQAFCEEGEYCCCKGEGSEGIEEVSEDSCDDVCSGKAVEDSCITREQCETLITTGAANKALKGDCGGGNVCCCS